MTTCPLCGQSVRWQSEFDVSLDANVAVVNGRPIRLQPREAEVLSVIAEAAPRVVSRDLLSLRCDPDREFEERLFDVYVCRLRKKLRRTDFTIEGVKGRGYRLVKA
jgi:DNA-binding response OmpR family regulator